MKKKIVKLFYTKYFKSDECLKMGSFLKIQKISLIILKKKNTGNF